MSPRPDITMENGQVYSRQFKDIYFSQDNGAAESQYVFLAGNDLPARWQGCACHSIAETGFGTGLNFLVTLRAWLDDPRRCATLDYYSVEAFPLQQEQLSTLYSDWPDFKELSDTLIAQYPPSDHGVHTLLFAEGRVSLHLLFMKLENALDDVAFNPDSWYLDGFDPARPN